MNSDTGGILGVFGFLVSMAGVIYTAINHKKIRCRCCGKDLDMSVDVDTTEEIKKKTKEEAAAAVAAAAEAESEMSMDTDNAYTRSTPDTDTYTRSTPDTIIEVGSGSGSGSGSGQEPEPKIVLGTVLGAVPGLNLKTVSETDILTDARIGSGKRRGSVPGEPRKKKKNRRVMPVNDDYSDNSQAI